MNRRHHTLALMSALAAASLPGCATAPATPLPINVISFGGGFNLPLWAAREVLGSYMGICGATRRSWAAQQPQAVTGFIRAYRDVVRWLLTSTNRVAAESLLTSNVPGMTAMLAKQSCDLMLHPNSGFFRDVQLDAQGVRRVLALRSKLAQPVKVLSDSSRYIDERY